MKKKFSVTTLKKISEFNKTIKVPGDKSISHRALILSAVATGESYITNLLESEDIFSTINILKKFGIKIEKYNNFYKINGYGLDGLKSLKTKVNFGNSGTSMRLMLGLLSAYPLKIHCTGDSSLNKRPVRVEKFLKKIGAIFLPNNKDKLPITMLGTSFGLAQKHIINVPSAQVKSSIILASLNLKGTTEIIEKYNTRDHTERMLLALKAKIKIKKLKKLKLISIEGQNEINSFKLKVPGDFSSSAFFIALTILKKNSSLKIKNVGTNPERIGFIKVLKKAGAKIKLLNQRIICGEPIADILIKSSKLKGLKCDKKISTSCIDELPILFCIAAFIKARSKFSGIGELKIKETNRFNVMAKYLRSAGIKVKTFNSRMDIIGNPSLKLKKQLEIDSMQDHRIAMVFAIFGFLIDGKVKIKNFGVVNTSFPTFLNLLKKFKATYEVK